MKKSGVELIAEERSEQIMKHGRTVKADVDFNSQPCEYRSMFPLALQALRVLETTIIGNDNRVKHFDKKITDKMESKPYKQRLIIAGAMIAAEIDRLNAIEYEETAD